MPEQFIRHPVAWEALDGIVKGVSAIDMGMMPLEDEAEAEQFVLNYGFSLENPADREELARIQDEAISFIERRFLSPEIPLQEPEGAAMELAIPAYMKDSHDIRQLLLTASNDNGLDQRWACAILKVMHTICHINNAVLYRYFKEAKAQILSRYNKALYHSDSDELMLGSPEDMHLPIAGFEIKDGKSRDSMILKLLCKRENVAEEVFDMIGVRIITHTPAEALLALEVLRRHKIIIFPNLIPSRSRNSLIDFDEFRAKYEGALQSYVLGSANLEETWQRIQMISTEEAGQINPENASTHVSYRSLHITERQLIRLTPPGSDQETRFFFPYEIQLLDEASYIQNHSGSSAHALYKQNQLIQARRRVLAPLFALLRKQQRHAAPHLEPEPQP